MSQKFSFVVEVKNGKPIGHVFKKEDAAKAKELFEKVREEGKEAYYFQSPNHDKRCKSTEQMDASMNTVSLTPEKKAEEPAQDKAKKNSLLGF